MLICCHFYARTQAAQRGAPTLSHTHTHTDSLSHTHTYTHTLVCALSLSVRSLITFLTRSARRAQPTSLHVHVMRKCTRAIGSRPTLARLPPPLSPPSPFLSFPLCCHTRALSYHICVCILASLLAALCSAKANDLQNSIFGMEYNALWNDVNVKPGIKINTRDIYRERGVWRGRGR